METLEHITQRADLMGGKPCVNKLGKTAGETVWLEMVQRYAHLSPGHWAAYADRTLLGEAPGTESGTPTKKERAANG